MFKFRQGAILPPLGPLTASHSVRDFGVLIHKSRNCEFANERIWEIGNCEFVNWQVQLTVGVVQIEEEI